MNGWVWWGIKFLSACVLAGAVLGAGVATILDRLVNR